MKISNRFAIAVHILSLLAIAPGERATSEWIAGSVNTNPVIIRLITGQLKQAGLVQVRSGSGGAYLTKETAQISLLDVYKAVEVVKEDELFHLHQQPNPQCPVGANIQSVLEQVVIAAQAAMEAVLAQLTLQQLVHELANKIKAN